MSEAPLPDDPIVEHREKLRQVAYVARERVGERLNDVWWWFLIRGVLAVGLAVVALFWPQKTISVLVNILGAYFLFDGLLGVIGAFRSGGRNGFPLFSIVSLMVGAILLFWTTLSVRVFLTLVGAWALLQGIGLFLSNRSQGEDAESSRLFAILGAVLVLIGLILVIWPSTGVVAISWLIAVVALILGGVLLFVAERLRRLSRRIDQRV
ncbi:HdeD family acid-resistance protein [Schlesneria paludicola]|uniref:HdeD family acid-resistance protein n=1 Tax=Schlesneria paludicola TaxID=360056 RepID=UPI000299D60F|nr:DUF308 domain-containing protein [Schlesneria paludicola]